MDDKTFWAITFAQILAFQYHPANRRSINEAESEIELAELLADKALLKYKEKFKE